MELGDSKTMAETHGMHRVTVWPDSCTTCRPCMAIDLHIKYDMVRGDDWLTTHEVCTNHGDGSATVF